jgi:hypothetical protein
MSATSLAARLARAVAAAGIVAAVASMGAPAQAHHEIDFESYECDVQATPDVEPDLTPPPTEPPDGQEAPPEGEQPTPAPQNCMPAEAERIWGTRLIRFSTSTDGARPIQRVALFILSQEESIPSPNDGEPVVEETFARAEDVRAYDTPFSWDSRQLTPYNGKYKIRVEVDTYPAFTGSEPHRAARERLNLRVDNAPLSVDAPKVVATTVGSATMNWLGAEEPDVLTYQIYRATTKSSTRPSYSAFKPVGVATTPGFRDGTVTPGTHWYAIKVTRRSIVTPDSGISSGLSAMSAPATVKSLEDLQKESDKGKDYRRPIAFRDLSPPKPSSRLAGVADAPFAYKLPYDKDDAVDGEAFEGSSSEGGGDPRGPVLPVAVGMFLVSSALAVGRMPY